MATLNRRSWDRYTARQAAQREAAAGEMMSFVTKAIGTATIPKLVANGRRIAVKHGRSAAALACVFYEHVARQSGEEVPKAVPVVVANGGRIEALVGKASGMLEAGDVDGFAKACGNAVANEVKRSASRTMMSNAKRDGAQFAWVPQGSETCAFCITVASNGWTYARRGTVEDHADHIHPNCECEFAIRFDNETNVAGYDPSHYEDMYKDAEGRNSRDKINAMRRDMYAENGDRIREQHRERYAALHQAEEE